MTVIRLTPEITFPRTTLGLGSRLSARWTLAAYPGMLTERITPCLGKALRTACQRLFPYSALLHAEIARFTRSAIGGARGIIAFLHFCGSDDYTPPVAERLVSVALIFFPSPFIQEKGKNLELTRCIILRSSDFPPRCCRPFAFAQG